MKNIMKKAHEMTRELKEKYPEINYQFQLGLCISYLLEEKEETAVLLEVKDWMLNKIGQEKGIRRFVDGEIFAVVKETEKAYQVILTASGLRPVTTWVPKSQVIVAEANGKSTHFNLTWEEAIFEHKLEMDMYR